jgi:hypothetical protein
MNGSHDDQARPAMTSVLLDALKLAAEAHGVHEATELGGVFDEKWPEWYAEHMMRTLSAQGYRLVHTATGSAPPTE